MNDDYFKVLDRLATYLAARDHSKRELQQKLARKFPEPELIEKAIAEAEGRGWILPPEELAETVALQMHRKNKSHSYIQQYLAQKGLPGIKMDEELEQSKIKKLLEIKFRKSGDFSHEEKQKAFRYLKYRGFLDSMIRTAIHNDV